MGSFPTGKAVQLMNRLMSGRYESTNMLEPDQWDAVLSRISRTIYRGTERISSNALLNLLEVGPDPVIRQKVAKRHKIPPALAARSEVLATVNGTAHRGTERISSNRLLDLLGVGGDPVTRQKVAKR